MENLHIITRCIRQQNLLTIKKSLENIKKFKLTWHIIFDISVIKEINTQILGELTDNIKIYYLKSENNAYGYNSVNDVIKKITPYSSWIYLLDDDNLLHENFDDINNYINSNTNIIIFNQYIGGKDFTGLEYRIASTQNTKVGGIDAAQYIIRRDVFEWNSSIKYVNDYCADGILIQFLLIMYPNEFLYINETFCYYNYIVKESTTSLPKILLIGADIKLESNNNPTYESIELNVMSIKNDTNINIILQKFKPNAIITIGDNSETYNMNQLSYDIRKKWLHFNEIHENIGKMSYYCANNSILSNFYKENPLISFFTPIYNTGEILLRTYESLKSQIYTNWEWVIVNDSNDNKTLIIAENIAKSDIRVKVYDFREKSGGVIGESKYRAACLCNGIYLMELDHDDYLTEDAALLMVKAFINNPDCKFVYSDCVEIYEDHNCITYGDGFSFGYGSYREELYNGKKYQVMNTSNINPKTIRHIVGVPNHFRAWDRFFYHSIGGHNRNLSIADDYELIIRTFLNTKMLRIPKMLYLQYYHDNNTQNKTRADIQRRVRSISQFYNNAINKRFLELGFVDWAYDFNNIDPLSSPSKFGDEEGYVNIVMEI